MSNIKGMNDDSMIGNIPVVYLNSTHKVYLFLKKIGNRFFQIRNSILIKLKIPSSINYSDGVNGNDNTVFIKYNDIFGINLGLINLENIYDTHKTYFTICDVNKNIFTINIGSPAIVEPMANGMYSDCESKWEVVHNVIYEE